MNDLGQIASVGFPNLSYFSKAEPVTKPGVLEQNPYDKISYDKTKTYLSVAVGDGDNLMLAKGRHLDWWNDRLELCSNEANYSQFNLTADTACFPLVWTLSAQVSERSERTYEEPLARLLLKTTSRIAFCSKANDIA